MDDKEKSADELLREFRSEGWAVAVHNDYRLGNEPHTFWLLTKGLYAVKGEGHSDVDALMQARKQVARVNLYLLRAAIVRLAVEDRRDLDLEQGGRSLDPDRMARAVYAFLDSGGEP